MKNHFFSHLIEIDALHVELEDMDLSDTEKEDIKKLIDESIYHTVLDAVLSELSEDDKKIFLSHLVGDEHQKIWDFVNGKVENIEEKIIKAAEDIKKELHQDIKTTKSHK